MNFSKVPPPRWVFSVFNALPWCSIGKPFLCYYPTVSVIEMHFWNAFQYDTNKYVLSNQPLTGKPLELEFNVTKPQFSTNKSWRIWLLCHMPIEKGLLVQLMPDTYIPLCSRSAPYSRAPGQPVGWLPAGRGRPRDTSWLPGLGQARLLARLGLTWLG